MEKLIFVYNADAGYVNMVADIAHKIFSPATYPCSLCDLTYGVFKIRPEWADFVEKSPIPLDFLHKDEFLLQFPNLGNTALPVVLKMSDDGVTTLIDKEKLDGFTTITDLKAAILARLS